MNQAYYYVAVTASCLGLLILPLLAGYYALQPLSRRTDAQANEQPVRRFTMLDFLALLVQIQFVLVALPLLAASQEYLAAGLIGTLMTIGVLAVWWAGVEVAARLKLRGTARRLLIHLVLLPGVVCIMPLTGLAASVLLAAMFQWSEAAGLTVEIGRTMLLFACVAAGLFFLRSLAGWIGRESPRVPAEPGEPVA